MKSLLSFIHLCILLSTIELTQQQRRSSKSTASKVSSTDVVLEFDESDISNLNLKVKWRLNSSASQSAFNPTKFVLLLEQKRLNFTTFSYEYATPQLLDDETVIKTSKMRADKMLARVPLSLQTSIGCALNCINSTKFSTLGHIFDCNIYYYEPHSKMCVLYQYNFNNKSNKVVNKKTPIGLGAFDYFIDDCEMDEILGDVVGYARYCRRILDYTNIHLVKINPYIDYRFSISLRDEQYNWTPFIRKEYQYTPKITIDVKGEVKLGKNITLECNIDLNASIVNSITWKDYPSIKNVLKINRLSYQNLHATYYCEIRFNFLRIIQKAFRLNVTSLEENKPQLKMNYSIETDNLNVKLNWTVSNVNFHVEKMILMYSENNQPYRFVNKYLLFDVSQYDNTRFALPQSFQDTTAENDDDCALKCLQNEFCDHFVFIRSIEPYGTSRPNDKNCQLAKNNFENILRCKYDSLCATLSSYNAHITNNSANILILPNTTYKFKLLLKDKFNWTDMVETPEINIPLNISVERKGDTILNDQNDNYELLCNTNINKNVEHQISWLKDDKELIIDEQLYSLSWSNETPHATSILKFKALKSNQVYQYSGVYKCKVYIRYPDVGLGNSYLSEAIRVDLDYSIPLRFNYTSSNISLPAIPGLLLEISCQAYGSPLPKLKWVVDGVDYNSQNLTVLSDEPFVINIDDKNNSLSESILIMKIDHSRPLTKYECVLNNNQTIREHFVQIYDETPKFDYFIDKSDLDNLKLAFRFVQNSDSSKLPAGVDSKPLKLSILYVENTDFSNAVQTIIAPDTLSKSNITEVDTSNRLQIATSKNTSNEIQSCKMLCFNTPFCNSYEYLMHEDSCNLYSDFKTNNYYKELIEKLKGSSNEFNLIHLLQANILSLVQEDSGFKNTTLVDKKAYPDCEPKPSAFFLTEELHCSDELADYTDVYTIANLIPTVIYQFKIEIYNAFGKSSSFYTEEIQVPFPINDIKENDEVRDNQPYYSLECSTTLTRLEKLKFEWYKNEQLIKLDDTMDYEQKIQQIVDENNRKLFKSELIFKQSVRNQKAFYECSVSYLDDSIQISQNKSFLYIQKVGPFYTPFTEFTVSKQLEENYTDSCSASGWPLPKLEWYLNGNPISNNTNEIDQSLPLMINHHSHSNVTSFLLIQNLSQTSIGVYSCVLDKKIYLKNVTVVLSGNAAENSKNDPSTQMLRQNKWPYFLILFAAIVLSAGIILGIIYMKKKKSDLSTSLSYNRIQEDIESSGVDNVNLISEE